MRLDGGTVDTGVEISAHFDSMLVRSSAGAGVRGGGLPGTSGPGGVPDPGVSTNIPFLQAVLEDPAFIAGGTCRHPSSRSGQNC